MGKNHPHPTSPASGRAFRARSHEPHRRPFAALKSEGRGALIPFLEAYDPDPATSIAILRGMPDAGADLIEIGMPFTDPMADGPTIQAAGLRGLKAGATLARTLAMVQELPRRRRRHAHHPDGLPQPDRLLRPRALLRRRRRRRRRRPDHRRPPDRGSRHARPARRRQRHRHHPPRRPHHRRQPPAPRARKAAPASSTTSASPASPAPAAPPRTASPPPCPASAASPTCPSPSASACAPRTRPPKPCASPTPPWSAPP